MRRGRTGPVVDALLVVLAVASLGELAATGVLAGGRTNPLASAAPALIALGVAVIGVWITLLAARLLIIATRGSTRVATFLAGAPDRPPPGSRAPDPGSGGGALSRLVRHRRLVGGQEQSGDGRQIHGGGVHCADREPRSGVDLAGRWTGPTPAGGGDGGRGGAHS